MCLWPYIAPCPAACGLLHTVAGGGDRKAATIRPGCVFNVEARSRFGAIVLDGISGGHLATVIQDAFFQMAMFILFQPHLEDSILLQLTGFTASH